MSIETPQPEYRQVARILRDRVRSGLYAPGELLPSEPELAAELKVSRAVVNKALALLRTEGLVRPQRGRGTTVNPIPVLRRNAIARLQQPAREADGARGAFDAEVRALGLVPRSDVTPGLVPTPPHIAEIFGTVEGEPVLARRRRMFADDIPVQLATSYIPWEIAEGTQLTEVDTGQGGAYSRLGDLGHAPARISELTRLRVPEGDEAQALAMDPDQRVFTITRIARTADGRAVEVTESVLPAHQWEMYAEWEIES